MCGFGPWGVNPGGDLLSHPAGRDSIIGPAGLNVPQQDKTYVLEGVNQLLHGNLCVAQNASQQSCCDCAVKRH